MGIESGQMEREDILNKVTELTKQADELKLEVSETVTSKYVDFDFLPNYTTSELLTERSQVLSSEIELVKVKIENEIKDQLNLSTGEFQTLTTDLQEANAISAVLQKMTKIHDGLELVDSSQKIHQYSTAALTLCKIEEYLKYPVHEREKEIKIFMGLYTEYKVRKEKLIYDLGDLWNEHLIWNVLEQPQKRKAVAKIKNELRIMTKKNEDTFKEVVIALEILGHLDYKLKSFGEKLIEHFIKPIINHCHLRKENENSDSVLLSVFGPEADMTVEARLFKLTNLMEKLSSSFLNLTIPNNTGSETSEISLMEKLGVAIADKLIKFTIDKCLADGIPSNIMYIGNFEAVANATKQLHNDLVTLKFITENNTNLTDYVENINVLFANKKSQEILVKARKLLTSEIHDMTLVDDDRPLGELPLLDKTHATVKARKLEIPVAIKLSGNSMKLPKCHISTCVKMIMQIAYETLTEAGQTPSQECKLQLYFAIRNMFELFCDVYQVYHKETLKTLPQQTALHHNNCMYIAHHLMTMGHQFSNQLQTTTNPTFVDLIPKIRRIGTGSFLEQLTRQRDQLLEYLTAAGDFINVAQDDNYFAVDKSFRQILHQLNHLQKIWQHVLPVNIYKKAIGTLLNSVLVEIINSITALEDISEDDGSQLTNLLTNLSEKSSLLFQIPDVESVNSEIDLQKNVAKWLKYKELMFILKASLQEISDRWAEGKGPIAHVFSSSEVKQMIRALFQNSDRRMTVLSKIK